MPLSDAAVDFVAGWVSGGVSLVCVQPVDTLLTRWQAGLVNIGGINWTFSSARSLAQTFGLKSLWRGSTPMITSIPLQSAILMGGYGVGQNYAENMTREERLTPIFVGGCTGGILQSFLMSPVEKIKVLQQCNLTESALATSKDVVTGLFTPSAWRGLSATLLRDGIPHGVWFVAYDVSKNNLEKEWGKETVTVPLLSGAIAAAVAWGVGYPADLIKTRQQAGGDLGIIDTAKQLIKEADGCTVQGLYRGFGLKLVRAVPASMIGFSVYEFVKKQIT